MFDELLESPAFWMLAGLGVGAEVLGWIMAKRMGWVTLPIWQLLVMIAGTLVAAGFFALRE